MQAILRELHQGLTHEGVRLDRITDLWVAELNLQGEVPSPLSFRLTDSHWRMCKVPKLVKSVYLAVTPLSLT